MATAIDASKIRTISRYVALLAHARSIFVREIDMPTLWLFDPAYLAQQQAQPGWNGKTWQKRKLMRDRLADIDFSKDVAENELAKPRVPAGHRLTSGGVSDATVDEAFDPSNSASFLASSRVLVAVQSQYKSDTRMYEPTVVGIGIVRPFYPVTGHYTVNAAPMDEPQYEDAHELYLIASDPRCPGAGEVVLTHALRKILRSRSRSYNSGVLSILATASMKAVANNRLVGPEKPFKPLERLCTKYKIKALAGFRESGGTALVPCVHRDISSAVLKREWLTEMIAVLKGSLGNLTNICKVANDSLQEQMLGAFCV
jgi:hypothetical protein